MVVLSRDSTGELLPQREGSSPCAHGDIGVSLEGRLPFSGLRIINAEKSEFNEDQAACGKLCIRRCEFGAEEEWLTLCPEEVSAA